MRPADILSSLEWQIEKGEPLPLAWVVAYGDEFEYAWNTSVEPLTLLKIAQRVVPLPELVAAVVAVARTAPRWKGESRPLRAIKTAEAWMRGEATIEEVKEAAGASSDASGDASCSAHSAFADAAAYAASTAFRRSYAAQTASSVASAVAWTAIPAEDYRSVDIFNARANIRTKSFRKSAAIIRKHIKITIVDLVRAGKNGWAAA